VERLNASEVLASQPYAGRGTARPGEQDEAVVLDIRGGEVTVAVSAGTPDNRVVGDASRLRGVLRLENAQVLTFEIRKADGRASLRHEPAAAYPETARLRGDARTAEEIMTREVLTTSPDMLVEDVAKRLAFHNISGMPVEDWDGRVIGIVSEADVLGKIGDTIRDVMSDEVIGVSRTTPLAEIASLLADRRIKRVPVLSDQRLVGIVSRADVIRALADQT
jgi:CBS-domain-containing membrane protein